MMGMPTGMLGHVALGEIRERDNRMAVVAVTQVAAHALYLARKHAVFCVSYVDCVADNGVEATLKSGRIDVVVYGMPIERFATLCNVLDRDTAAREWNGHVPVRYVVTATVPIATTDDIARRRMTLERSMLLDARLREEGPFTAHLMADGSTWRPQAIGLHT